jgi:hypothetical protein
MPYPAFIVLRVALAAFYRHSAHRIFGGTLSGPDPAMSFVPPLIPVNRVCATAEAHHQVKESCKK